MRTVADDCSQTSCSAYRKQQNKWLKQKNGNLGIWYFHFQI